ncbi:MAG TPA: 50S ribosomal protein L4 [Candidatus Paceibacterota bacterium]|nr:50S ribosomal protein L4 [Candidatus Paceibacterota bacterium]
MKKAIFDKNGKESKQISLPKEIFDVALNKDLVHQVVVSMTSNSRENIAHTKDRAEVSGGGKKPWKQKGTGRARHGSTRSPIWIGGGITFGPRNEKDYSRKISKKIKAKVLAMIFSQKNRDNEIVLIEPLDLKEIKTKSAKEILTNISKNKEYSDLSSRRNSTAVIVLSNKNNVVQKSFQNIPGIKIDTIKNVNILEILNYKYVILENPEESLKVLTNRVIISNDNK